MELKPAICPSCGADLKLPEDKKVLKCMYCGKDIIVHDAIEKAVGPIIGNYLSIAISAKNAGNYKEAYDYFTKVLELNPRSWEAWFGKGEAAGWLSKLDDFRVPEMVTGIENAVKYAPAEKKEELKLNGADMINKITIAFFTLSSKHVFDYGSASGAGQEFLNRCLLMENALQLAHSYSPTDKQILDNLIYLCQFQIEGVVYKDFNGYGETRAVLRVSPGSEAMLKERMDGYVSKRKALDPSYEAPSIKKKGCFIVTATMGNLNHPYTVLLRQFRDEWLSKRVAGKEFTEMYYHISPYLANIIRNRKPLSLFSYVFLVKTWVWLAKRMLNNSEDKN